MKHFALISADEVEFVDACDTCAGAYLNGTNRLEVYFWDTSRDMAKNRAQLVREFAISLNIFCLIREDQRIIAASWVDDYVRKLEKVWTWGNN